MAKLLGNNYRLWVESSTPGTYNMVAGQQDLSISRNAALIDTSSKDDSPYATQAPGLRTLNIALSGVADLPDADGFTRLETLALAAVQAAFNVQIRKGGASGADPADVVFQGSVYATDWNQTMGQNAAVNYSTTLVAADQPTTDTLA